MRALIDLGNILAPRKKEWSFRQLTMRQLRRENQERQVWFEACGENSASKICTYASAVIVQPLARIWHLFIINYTFRGRLLAQMSIS